MPYADLLRGRCSITGQIYLVTTRTHDRLPLFTNLYSGRIVVRSLHSGKVETHATTLAYVVMPDHLHWLVQLGADSNLSDVVRLVKGRSAFEINRARRMSTPVWQLGFHDHALRTEESVREAAEYVVRNPLRAGLVTNLGDYSLWDAAWLESGWSQAEA